MASLGEQNTIFCCYKENPCKQHAPKPEAKPLFRVGQVLYWANAGFVKITRVNPPHVKGASYTYSYDGNTRHIAESMLRPLTEEEVFGMDGRSV